ncbi:MAG: DNA mismatch repair endonuclease MutL [candidate division WOR-3 bacterium]|nr:DNA mismatch repair endonuclease MutL [candidate division WOR-3 bacterium]
MPKIKILSEDVRSKIAAGEVIIRPVSVIKELIENSLDADAKRIEIEIENGGKKKCLVNDDGTGMSREDALLSIERYATSKIEKIEDIENIKTFGFRGEALASIAQVSHLEIETSDGTTGTKIIVEGGELKQVFDFFRERGTRVRVSDLFFNLPARRKFLKSDEYERRLIIELVKTYAIIMPKIHFLLSERQRNILNLPPVSDPKMRLAQLYPLRLVERLIPLELELGSTKITGLISPLNLAEDLNFNLIYINHRPVRYPRIARIINETYQNPKEPPSYVLDIILPPDGLDVNIHPAKSEVKIKDERYIIDLLTQTIKSKLFPKPMPKEYPDTEPLTGSFRNHHLVQEFLMPYGEIPVLSTAPATETGEFWQLHNTYIFAQTSTGFIIVDQHAAHERILYEEIMNNRGSTQHLLFPITLELTSEEYQTYEKTRDLLKELGIEFKEFSGRTLVLDALPSDSKISREDLQGFFSEIGSLGKLMHQKSELAKIIACRMAIKAGQKLSIPEMQGLIDRLFACENPFICPHGRPVVIKFSLEDLDQRFGR